MAEPDRDIERLGPDEALALINRWRDLGGDETGPPQDWCHAVELVEEAYERLSATRDVRDTLIALSDAYSTVIDRHIKHE